MTHPHPPAGSTESGDPAKRQSLDRSAPAATDPSASRWNWVPVRSLTARHRERFLTHLMALSEHDRYLRFGYPATDAQIGKYVDTLDFERDEVFGIFNRKLALIAAAHLAYSPAPQRSDHPAMAEFGVSVIPAARGRRFGSRLFDHAILHARNRGVPTLFIHALSENTAMLRIARSAGARVARDGSESEAWLELPPETIGSRFDEVLGHNVAEFDYQFKRQANRVNSLLEAIAEVKKNLGSKAHAASE
jgi:GNAT superfamily N-acetyltransferase